MMALINPKLGKFNVTAKGGVVKRTFFDSRIAQPFLVMLLFNIAGLIVAIPRFFIWDDDRPGTVLMNVMWCCFNIIILGVCTAVARELQQLRTTVRINVVTPARGQAARWHDRSPAKPSTCPAAAPASVFSEAVDVTPQSQVRLAFPVPSAAIDLPATVVSSEGSVLRVRFENLSIAEQEVLTMVLYSRADSWLGWGEARESDNVLRSLGRIFQISMHGLKATFRSLFSDDEAARRKSGSLSIARASDPAPSGCGASHGAAKLRTPSRRAMPAQRMAMLVRAQAPATDINAPVPPGPVSRSLHARRRRLAADRAALASTAGTASTSRCRRPTCPHREDSRLLRLFSQPPSAAQPSQAHYERNALRHHPAHAGPVWRLRQPRCRGRFHHSSRAAGAQQHAHHRVHRPLHHGLRRPGQHRAVGARSSQHLSSTFAATCCLWPTISSSCPCRSSIPPSFSRSAFPSSLPRAPSLKAIQAAGIVTSYFGLISENRPVRFPVHIGAIPHGQRHRHCRESASLPAGLESVRRQCAHRGHAHQPQRSLRQDPDRHRRQCRRRSSIAAQAIALHSDMLNGPQTAIDNLQAARQAGARRRAALGAHRSDHRPLGLRHRRPAAGRRHRAAQCLLPHSARHLLQLGQDPTPACTLVYRYNSIPIGPISSMQVRVNNAFLGSIPLVPGQETSRKHADRRARSGRQPAPVLQLALLRLHLPAAQKDPGCKDTTPINMQGAILRDSYLDLRGYPHWAPCPISKSLPTPASRSRALPT